MRFRRTAVPTRAGAVMPRRPGPPPGRGRRKTTNRPARRRCATPSRAADDPRPVRPRPPCRARKSHLRRSRRVLGKPNPPRGSCDTRLLPVVCRRQATTPLAAPPVDHLASLARRHSLAKTVRSLAPRSVWLVGSFHESTSQSRPAPRRTRAGDITGSRDITRRGPPVSSDRAALRPRAPRPKARPFSADRPERRFRNVVLPGRYKAWTVIEYVAGSEFAARTRTKNVVLA